MWFTTASIPYVVKDDYLYRVPDAANTEMIFQISNLDPGRYSVTLFEGHADRPNQVARLWVGDDNGSNEPAGPNTGSFSGVGPDGPNEKVFLALSRSVSVKESIFG